MWSKYGSEDWITLKCIGDLQPSCFAFSQRIGEALCLFVFFHSFVRDPSEKPLQTAPEHASRAGSLRTAFREILRAKSRRCRRRLMAKAVISRQRFKRARMGRAYKESVDVQGCRRSNPDLSTRLKLQITQSGILRMPLISTSGTPKQTDRRIPQVSFFPADQVTPPDRSKWESRDCWCFFQLSESM